MAMFVHITAAKFERDIRRAGLGGGKTMLSGGKLRRAHLYCFPVLESHTLTHQWTREILKWRRQPLVAVYFRLPDDEQVQCSRFTQRLRTMTAAEAVALIRAHEGMQGFEVLVSRKITPKEIHRIAPVRGVVGWRHAPDAHGKKPCGCPYCLKGQPDSRALVARYHRGEL